MTCARLLYIVQRVFQLVRLSHVIGYNTSSSIPY